MSAAAAIGAAALLMSISYALALLFRWRFQFSIRSLLLLAVVVALPSGWLAVEVRKAREQAEIVKAIGEWNHLRYNYEIDADLKEVKSPAPPGPRWLRDILGDDFFSDVAAAVFNYDYPKPYDMPLSVKLKYLNALSELRQSHLTIARSRTVCSQQ